MTHTSTEQERASLGAFIDRVGRDGFDTAHNFFDCGEVVFFNPATADLWDIWQASRRAQVVHKCSECEDTGVGVSHGYDCTSCYGALSAAPKPPEAACNPSMQPLPELATKVAPVQLPEPVAVVVGVDRRVFADGVLRVSNASVSFYDLETVDLGSSLYTEHQVRQLLAQHGIK